MKFTKFQWIVLGGAGALLVSFFLPWVSVSTGVAYFGAPYKYSLGPSQIVGLSSTIGAIGDISTGWSTLYYLLPLGAIVTAVMVFVAANKPLKSKMVGISSITTALISIIILVLSFFGWRNIAAGKVGEGYIRDLMKSLSLRIGYSFGFWLAVVAAVLLLVGGVAMVREKKSAGKTTTPSPSV